MFKKIISAFGSKPSSGSVIPKNAVSKLPAISAKEQQPAWFTPAGSAPQRQSPAADESMGRRESRIRIVDGGPKDANMSFTG